jgi:hypothetical protein
MKDPGAFPSEALRRKLAAIGIPPERHALGELRRLLPGEPSRLDVDSVAEVVIYLVGKRVLEIPAGRLLVPWGERRCAHYTSPQELVSVVLPWLRDGIAANERCIWLASSPLAIAEDGLELIDPADWGNSWQREEQRTLAQGYAGLRVCADMRALHDCEPGPRSRQLCMHNGADE